MAKRACDDDSDTSDVSHDDKREKRPPVNIAFAGVHVHRVARLPQFDMSALRQHVDVQNLLRSTLREYGAVEVTDVLTAQDCEVARSHFWDYMEALGTGIVRDDVSTHTNARWPRSFSLGMIDEPEAADAGQSKMCWYVRQRENIRLAFSYAYGCAPDELAGSLDRFGMQRTATAREKRRSDLWMHVDQNPVRADPHSCYQGVVNILPTRNGDPGFVCVPHSHFKLSQWPQHVAIKSSQRDFIRLSDETISAVLPETAEVLKVNAAAGSLILFSSALVHCNGRVEHAGMTDVNGLCRLVVYASMQPVTRFPNWETQVLPQRLAMYEAGVTSTHWTEFCKVLGKIAHQRPAQHVKLARRVYEKVALNDEQMRWLCGPFGDESKAK